MPPLYRLPLLAVRRLLAHRLVAFAVMGAAFVGFAVGTVSLGLVAKANVELVAAYGWQAVMDGAAAQWLDIALTTYASMACYLLFKACERRLVQAIDPL